ncbi:UDP-N-acetylmuramoyl-L-alanyl-D-glutamate--2,6-diaminopimelate ligase [Marinimicrobium alkaliphilum]|uniref:UDP-N-acetylmuramoyl-L-alanyl-D-glutamate--2, 6-diaminopimelate ligase n=1 Tax=Marinimicrobium alkaliphilum TaxID=2202654 RepID=UPI000DB9B08B|nr:UDP-N-acetylmuramoyl-L-alanyl-D-glutamate--2,6-diaminopimelate ligase [Marinimicrobium alkaliphilum]
MTASAQPTALALADLLPGLPLSECAARCEVRGLTLDSRRVRTGDVFVAIPGQAHDGRLFIEQAITAGAAAILAQSDDDDYREVESSVPHLCVPTLAAELSAIAGRFWGEPSAQLHVTGVTGTNGKTSCTLLLGQLLALTGQPAGVLGTLGFGVLPTGADDLPGALRRLDATGLTTPDAIAVQQRLAEARERGADAVVMEVSSHSLVQHRAASVRFDVAIFTNLSRDHLDYHGDMTRYGDAKAQLLKARGLQTAVLNLDDTWASSLQTQLPEGVTGITYSLTDAAADVRARDLQAQATGTEFMLTSPWGEARVRTALVGDFALSNLLAVIAAAGAQGVDFAALVEALPLLQPAPGRMEAVTLDTASAQDVGVIVDYAHTPAALETVLQALQGRREQGRLWCVFGCGGDRDTGKRPEMGRSAERLSDCVVVTNDNPRTEDPATIVADIVRGMHNPNGCLVIADRAQAIDLAVQQAHPGDTVLIAGKGHEDYQIFGDQTLPFSDVKQSRLALQRRFARLQEVRS